MYPHIESSEAREMTTNTTTTGRTEAELIENDDGTFEVLPPQVEVNGSIDEQIIEAVTAALADEPNALIEPVLVECDDEEFGLARFIANYQEQPATGDNGELLGWRAPYRSREDIDAALREHLPEDVGFEAKNNHTTVLFSEGGR